jgi:biopolymer transport protein ExbD
MRIQGAKKIHYDSGPNMTPLVDVVMVILIFLMMCGSFSQGGWFLQSSVPIKSKSGAKADVTPGLVPDEPLEVRIDNSADGFRVLAGDIRSSGDKEQLRAALERKRVQFETVGTAKEKVQVVLMPGRNVKYENIVAVYEAALRAGFSKVGFATSH